MSLCCICKKDLGNALPVIYFGENAHMRCVDKKEKMIDCPITSCKYTMKYTTLTDCLIKFAKHYQRWHQ